MSATRSAVLAALAALLAGDGAGNVLLDQSPPQFDSSLKLATMGAVQRALGNSNGFRSIIANTSLAAADIGSYIAIAVAGVSVNLPSAILCPGGTINVYNDTVSSCSISTGIDKINVGTKAAAATAVSVTPGDCATFLSDGTNWTVFGSMQLTQSTLFGSSISVSGYQKLPSGLIIQWGTSTTTSSGANTPTFPLAFPNGVLQAFITDQTPSVSSTNCAFGWQPVGKTSMNVYANQVVVTSYSYLVIGY